ncbi:hypothetical protein ACFW9F_06685 [Streptomyces sp. NPDC059506]|nr:hypothetical protein [Streptomyces sp. SCUT-3]QMV21212.1 hypothetical protein GQS52_04865 [Streptomyces sp. SCUT-3]
MSGAERVPQAAHGPAPDTPRGARTALSHALLVVLDDPAAGKTVGVAY